MPRPAPDSFERMPRRTIQPRASVLIALGAGFTGLAASAIALWANPSPVILAVNLLLIAINAAVVVANLVLVRRFDRLRIIRDAIERHLPEATSTTPAKDPPRPVRPAPPIERR